MFRAWPFLRLPFGSVFSEVSRSRSFALFRSVECLGVSSGFLPARTAHAVARVFVEGKKVRFSMIFCIFRFPLKSSVQNAKFVFFKTLRFHTVILRVFAIWVRLGCSPVILPIVL